MDGSPAESFEGAELQSRFMRGESGEPIAMARHPAALPPDELLKECAERFVRRSGPGGQNRNKVETGVVLTHRPTGTTAEATERRSQGENRRIALRRLRTTLATEFRTPPDENNAANSPSAAWTSRVRGGRIVLSEQHDDYPTLLAEALDCLAAADWDAAAAASRLGVTTTQFVRLIRTEPRAFRQLNAARAARGLSPLR